jgi:hypothetical protein
MKLSLPPKLVEKLVWVIVISFCKISFPVTLLIPYYAETDRSCPLIAYFTDNFSIWGISFKKFKTALIYQNSFFPLVRTPVIYL